MLLTEAIASSLGEIRATFEAAFPDENDPNRMTAAELFNLIKILYRFQTSDEQKAASVHHRNNAGFSVTDAKKLTDFYNWYVKRKYYTDAQKCYIGDLLRKHCMQLIRYWQSKGIIKHDCRGMYSYESKAERQARQAREAEERVTAGAEQFRREFAATQTPEAKAEERVKQNHGQLDFLNDL